MGDPVDVARGYRTVLGVRTGAMGAYHPQVGTDLLAALHTEGAGAARDRGKHGHAVPDPDGVHTVSQRGDDARVVGAQHVGRLDLGVGVVRRRGP